jgi:poly [ADP-ribose] polymerase
MTTQYKPTRLIMVTADNNNKYYSMTPNALGTEFEAEWGRVGVTSTKKIYPISKWNSTYSDKTKKGYKDVTELVKENTSTGNSLTQIQEPRIDALMTKLLGYAKKSVQTNYTISSDVVTPAQVSEAQGKLDELAQLATTFDLSRVNKLLLDLYMTIPRRMSNVKHYLIDVATNDPLTAFRGIIDTEQKTLDVMSGQVKMRGVSDNTSNIPNQTILDTLGITVELADDADRAIVQKLMGFDFAEFRAMYRVRHTTSKTKYDDHLANATNKKQDLFWHGSRNENWISILQSSLIIRPSNAILNGSMWGDGIYGANKYRKSANYTSLRNSYWAKGKDNSAYLGLFDFHTGNQLHLHKHDQTCYKLCAAELKQRGNFDSVYAHGGWDLVNDEFIVYTNNQTTIRYLVEVGI